VGVVGWGHCGIGCWVRGHWGTGQGIWQGTGLGTGIGARRERHWGRGHWGGGGSGVCRAVRGLWCQSGSQWPPGKAYARNPRAVRGAVCPSLLQEVRGWGSLPGRCGVEGSDSGEGGAVEPNNNFLPGSYNVLNSRWRFLDVPSLPGKLPGSSNS
jgi:hypothetical protein